MVRHHALQLLDRAYQQARLGVTRVGVVAGIEAVLSLVLVGELLVLGSRDAVAVLGAGVDPEHRRRVLGGKHRIVGQLGDAEQRELGAQPEGVVGVCEADCGRARQFGVDAVHPAGRELRHVGAEVGRGAGRPDHLLYGSAQRLELIDETTDHQPAEREVLADGDDLAPVEVLVGVLGGHDRGLVAGPTRGEPGAELDVVVELDRGAHREVVGRDSLGSRVGGHGRDLVRRQRTL